MEIKKRWEGSTLSSIPENVMLLIFEFVDAAVLCKEAWSNDLVDIGILRYRLVSRAFNRYSLQSLKEINLCKDRCPVPICYDCGTCHSNLNAANPSLLLAISAFPLQLRSLDFVFDVSRRYTQGTRRFLQNINMSCIARLNIFVDLKIISFVDYLAFKDYAYSDIQEIKRMYDVKYSAQLNHSLQKWGKDTLRHLDSIGLVMPSVSYIEVVFTDNDDNEMIDITTMSRFQYDEHEFKRTVKKNFPALEALQVNTLMVMGERHGASRGLPPLRYSDN